MGKEKKEKKEEKIAQQHTLENIRSKPIHCILHDLNIQIHSSLKPAHARNWLLRYPFNKRCVVLN